jgi:hypothetical protein
VVGCDIKADVGRRGRIVCEGLCDLPLLPAGVTGFDLGVKHIQLVAITLLHADGADEVYYATCCKLMRKRTRTSFWGCFYYLFL